MYILPEFYHSPAYIDFRTDYNFKFPSRYLNSNKICRILKFMFKDLTSLQTL